MLISDILIRNLLRLFNKNLNIIIILLKINFNTITYCPLLIHIGFLLKLFFYNKEVYGMLLALLKDSYIMLTENNDINSYRSRIARSLKWHFYFTKDELNKISLLFLDYLKDKSNTCKCYINSLEDNSSNFIKFIKKGLKTFYLDILPHDLLLIYAQIFLNEGIRVILVIIYGVIKYFNLKDKKTDNIISYLKNNIIPASDYKQFIKTSFKLSLKRTKNKISNIILTNSQTNSDKNLNNTLLYYDLDINSNIISEDHFEQLLNKINEKQKLSKKIKKIFSIKENGLSYNFMVNSLKDTFNSYLIDGHVIIIRTGLNNIIGFYFTKAFDMQDYNSYISDEKSFIFSLYPTVRFYDYKLVLNDFRCYNLDGNGIYVGYGEEGHAIFIDKSLKQGTCKICKTYGNNELLAEEEFKIEQLEYHIFYNV